MAPEPRDEGRGYDDAVAWREFLFHLYAMRRRAIGTFALVLLLALLLAGLLPPDVSGDRDPGGAAGTGVYRPAECRIA